MGTAYRSGFTTLGWGNQFGGILGARWSGHTCAAIRFLYPLLPCCRYKLRTLATLAWLDTSIICSY